MPACRLCSIHYLVEVIVVVEVWGLRQEHMKILLHVHVGRIVANFESSLGRSQSPKFGAIKFSDMIASLMCKGKQSKQCASFNSAHE